MVLKEPDDMLIYENNRLTPVLTHNIPYARHTASVPRTGVTRNSTGWSAQGMQSAAYLLVRKAFYKRLFFQCCVNLSLEITTIHIK